MMHSVEFLDQTGNVVCGSQVEAPDDASAFRMVANDWPGAACCVRILEAEPWQDRPQYLRPPRTGSIAPARPSAMSAIVTGRRRAGLHGRRWIGSTQ